MLILLVFSFLAGIVTVFSPCVLPVLPPLLAAGYTKNPSRSWGIILGFISCFTFAILTLSQALHSIGATGNWLHLIAAIILGVFGLILLIPKLGEIFERLAAPIARLGNTISTRTAEGFGGGVLLGFALGLLWTPCAGPILATIIILSTLNAVSLTTVGITLAYALGAAIPMMFIMRGSSYLKKSLSSHPSASATLRSIFGVLTIAAAVGIATNWTEVFQKLALEYIPIIEVENNALVKKRLAGLVKADAGNSFVLRVEDMNATKDGVLPLLGKAPAFPANDKWLNSKPLTMNELEGKVVLIDFWTYSCINCLRTLPYLSRWYDNYKDKGLVIVGVHTPEFSFEKVPENVQDAIKRLHVNYPVVLDNDYAIWKSYGNLYWPAHYLIDKQGNLRYFHFGEGKYIETENAIRSLLGLTPMNGIDEMDRRRATTPETYLGYKRAQGYPFELDIFRDKEHRYVPQEVPNPDQVTLEGDWIVHEDHAESTSPRSYIRINFIGTKVYLVLGGMSKEPVQVMLDSKPLPAKYYSKDMNSKGQIFIKEPRKYDMIDLGRDYGRHELQIHIPEGISAYAFTFGDE
ncbi:MAG: cytochrome c biogenesis protein DipZ [Parachlamydiales bacterium]|jgi:cytochrome c biogenesis protein CcdA/thiol-disulfide isomerase/thioredoxin